MRGSIFLLIFVLSQAAWGQSPKSDLDSVSLGDLLDVQVMTTAKMKSESTFDAPGVVTVITAEEIKRFGAKNFEDVLSRLNGVYMNGSGLFPDGIIVVRGDLDTHYDNHTLILINGRPFRDSGHNGDDGALIKNFPVDVIDRVELVRGPGSVLYGTDAMDGVVNIITKKKMNGNTARLGYGSRDAIVADGAIGNDVAVAGVHYLNDSGSVQTFKDDAGTVGNSTYTNNDNGAFASFNKNGFSLNMFQGSSHDGNLGPLEELPPSFVTRTRAFVDAGYQHNWSAHSTGSYNLTYNRDEFVFTQDTTSGAFVKPDTLATSNDFLFETTHDFMLTDQLDLTVGGLAQELNANGFTAWTKVENEDSYSGYAQLKYRPIQPLSFVAGAQGNKVRKQSKMDVVPRLGVIYNHDDNYGAKILYGSAFRSPSGAERFANSGSLIGNEDLQPEHESTLDVQVLGKISQMSLALTYFDSKITNIIERSGSTAGNVGVRHIHGVEFDGKWVPSNHALVNLGVEYQQNDDDGVTNNALSPNTMVKLGVAYNFDMGISLGAYDQYSSKVSKEDFTTKQYNPSQGDYHWVSLNAEFDLQKLVGCPDSSIDLYANNLANTSMYHTDFDRRSVNTVPYDQGATYYAFYVRKF